MWGHFSPALGFRTDFAVLWLVGCPGVKLNCDSAQSIAFGVKKAELTELCTGH